MPVHAHFAASLTAGAASLGLTLDARAVEHLARYGELLERWNERMNLTRVPVAEFIPAHLLDSLALAAVTGPLSGSLIDVGSGAGFPGLPLKIAFPELEVTLLEATGKKVAFMDHVISELRLGGCRVIHGRAEEAGHAPELREHFDWAVARAVASLRELAELLVPFVRPGGHGAALKGPGAEGELNAAAGACAALAVTAELRPVQVPGLEAGRSIIILSRQGPLDPLYPRSPAKIKKRPL